MHQVKDIVPEDLDGEEIELDSSEKQERVKMVEKYLQRHIGAGTWTKVSGRFEGSPVPELGSEVDSDEDHPPQPFGRNPAPPPPPPSSVPSEPES